MIQKIIHIKLRNQIFFLFLFILIMIFGILLTFIHIISNVSRNASIDRLTNSTQQLAKVVESQYLELKDQAGVLVYNNEVSNFVESETPGKRYTNYKKILSLINSIEATNKDIRQFMYINRNMLYIANSTVGEYRLIEKIKNSKDINRDLTDAYSGDVNYYRMVLEPEHSVYYTIIGASCYDYYLDEPMFMVLLINKDPIIKMVQNFHSSNSLFLLVDDKNDIIASSPNSLPGSDKSIEQVKGEIKAGKNIVPVSDNTNNEQYFEVGVSNIGWKVIGVSDVSMMDRDAEKSKNLIFLITIIMTLLILLYAITINGSIISPILHITNFVQKINNDYTTKRLNLHKSNEIGIMAHEINRMLDNICLLNENMTKTQQILYMAEISKRQASVAALQSQINPHFLYNTLDCIRGIALKENINSIANIANSVSKIFRYSIKADDFVRIIDEINCIKDYIVIISVRFSNRLTTSFEIESNLQNLFIPKMILQPIVENAVFHGLEPKKGPGHISVKVFPEHDNTVFSIKDDGVGININQLAELRNSFNENIIHSTELNEKKSIGIINIYQRLALIFGANFSMTVDSEINKGTEVCICIRNLSNCPPT